jgi:hypothetical protein
MSTPDPVRPGDLKRSQRWLQLLIVLAGAAFLWLVYRVGWAD